MTKDKIKTGSHPVKMYNCDDIEEYMDRAITKVKNEIIPRIDSLDQRDRVQFETAKEIIVSANTLVAERQKLVEKGFEMTRQELGLSIKNIGEVMHNLHIKFDQHTNYAIEEFKKLNNNQEVIRGNLESVERLLNTVSANGSQGLETSLKDLYSKNTAVHNDVIKLTQDMSSFRGLVQPILDRKIWWTSTKRMLASTAFFKLLQNKLGFVVFIFWIWVLANILLHVFTNGAISLGFDSLLKILGY